MDTDRHLSRPEKNTVTHTRKNWTAKPPARVGHAPNRSDPQGLVERPSWPEKADDSNWKALVKEKPAKDNRSNFENTSTGNPPTPIELHGPLPEKICWQTRNNWKTKEKTPTTSTSSSTGRTKSSNSPKGLEKETTHHWKQASGEQKPP
jgi:hypothetical protein